MRTPVIMAPARMVRGAVNSKALAYLHNIQENQ
ncbi:hypothetical protein PR003_g19132 [Phytophthora rubi]|uniref:Uncharacterized protein n=1 Tax=Phytophthora rubi TaxID=129364 RepID=A0A6A4E819_9STRA|nr:hypothetical protein PR003_g19132 [Phytophthora rubi]